MRRREFLGVLSGAAVLVPFAACAQRSTPPTIGFLTASSPSEQADRIEAFRLGLKEAGLVDGGNVTIEYRWTGSDYDRFPALAAELVRRQVSVIFAGPTAAAPLAAQAAATTIPIVFLTGVDPVEAGLVASVNRPGGNITGVSTITPALGAKRVEILRELVPNATTIAVLVNSNNPNSVPAKNDVQAAAHKLQLRSHVQSANTEQDLERAFAAFAREKAELLLVTGDAFFTSQRHQLAALAARYAIPTSYAVREFVDSGGLMSYGPSFVDSFRKSGFYVGRILRGTHPTDLPVLYPTKFDLVINLKTAKALGLTVPQSLLATADALIE